MGFTSQVRREEVEQFVLQFGNRVLHSLEREGPAEWLTFVCPNRLIADNSSSGKESGRDFRETFREIDFSGNGKLRANGEHGRGWRCWQTRVNVCISLSSRSLVVKRYSVSTVMLLICWWTGLLSLENRYFVSGYSFCVTSSCT